MRTQVSTGPGSAATTRHLLLIRQLAILATLDSHPELLLKANTTLLWAMALALSSSRLLAADPASATTTLAPVSVHASDSLVTAPSVQVRVDRKQMQRQNVTSSADALKYVPNMMVRARYIGDPNAVISGRNAGTLQSARSLVYADGLLLSNLMSNGYNGAPRWGMVAPEEIGTIDVLYGPYSALYPATRSARRY